MRYQVCRYRSGFRKVFFMNMINIPTFIFVNVFVFRVEFIYYYMYIILYVTLFLTNTLKMQSNVFHAQESICTHTHTLAGIRIHTMFLVEPIRRPDSAVYMSPFCQLEVICKVQQLCINWELYGKSIFVCYVKNGFSIAIWISWTANTSDCTSAVYFRSL